MGVSEPNRKFRCGAKVVIDFVNPSGGLFPIRAENDNSQ